MATKIRLQRGGHKGYAVYRIVIADVRAPRDGKFIEKIGTFNPNTNPATVDLNFDRALYWVETGAQPTDTVRTILKGEGVYMMKHLRGGVKKGAFDEAACQQKFDAWKTAKEQKLTAGRSSQLLRTLRARAVRRLLLRLSMPRRRSTRLSLRRWLTRRLQRLLLRLRPRLQRLLKLLKQRRLLRHLLQRLLRLPQRHKSTVEIKISQGVAFNRRQRLFYF